jgi:hypothetical protein
MSSLLLKLRPLELVAKDLNKIYNSEFGSKPRGRYRISNDELAYLLGALRISSDSLEKLKQILYELYDLAAVTLNGEIAILNISTMERYRKANKNLIKDLGLAEDTDDVAENIPADRTLPFYGESNSPEAETKEEKQSDWWELNLSVRTANCIKTQIQDGTIGVFNADETNTMLMYSCTISELEKVNDSFIWRWQGFGRKSLVDLKNAIDLYRKEEELLKIYHTRNNEFMNEMRRYCFKFGDWYAGY